MIKLLLLTFSLFKLDFHSYYLFPHNHGLPGLILHPIGTISLKRPPCSASLLCGPLYTLNMNSSRTFKFYQIFLKASHKDWEFKLGKILHWVGPLEFPNPFMKPLFLEAFNLFREGKYGINIKKFSKHTFSLFVFADRAEKLEISNELQIHGEREPFSYGIYWGTHKFGLFVEHYGVMKTRNLVLISPQILSFIMGAQRFFGPLFFDISYLYTQPPDTIHLPFSMVLYKKLITLRLSLPQEIFETPSFIILLFPDERLISALFQLNMVIADKAELTWGGLFENFTKEKLKIFVGLKLTHATN